MDMDLDLELEQELDRIRGIRKSFLLGRMGGKEVELLPEGAHPLLLTENLCRHHPLAKRKHPSSPSGSNNALPGRFSSVLDASDPDTIRCVCGYTTDDVWSIGCDGCSRWVHGVCFGTEMKDEERLPER